jgi:hypothetical protein
MPELEDIFDEPIYKDGVHADTVASGDSRSDDDEETDDDEKPMTSQEALQAILYSIS